MTETTKWADPWFRGLDLKQKAIWLWLLDNCDCAGVVPEIDLGLASFQIGATIEASDLAVFTGRLEQCGKGFWVRKFVAFQYGRIECNTSSKVHQGVMKALGKASIPLPKAMESLSIALPKAINSPKDKDKDKDKDPEKEPEEEISCHLPFTSSAFAIAWTDWVKHRSEIRKPIKPTMRKAQLADMAKMGEARAISAIQYTISKGWQGLAEPDAQQTFRLTPQQLRPAVC